MSDLSNSLVAMATRAVALNGGTTFPTAAQEQDARSAVAAAFRELFAQGYVCAYPNHDVERPTLHIFALAREIERGA